MGMSYDRRMGTNGNDIPDSTRTMNTMGVEPNMREDMQKRKTRTNRNSMRNSAMGNEHEKEVEEVYKTISERMCEALEFHFQLADYFCFLGLQGFKRMAEYQYMKECAEKRKLHKRYIDMHHKIIPVVNIEQINIIPSEWSRYTTADVDDNSIPKYVRNALEQYYGWEHETKEILQEQHETLMNLGLASDAEYIKELMVEAEKEIKKVSRLYESMNGTGYDVNAIHSTQPQYHDKYKQKYREHFTTKAMRQYPEFPDDGRAGRRMRRIGY